MPMVQNDQEPVVGGLVFYYEWFEHTARSTSLNHDDNDTTEKSQVNSKLYRSRSNATSRFRELLSLLSSLLERLWYNFLYIYNDTPQATFQTKSMVTDTSKQSLVFTCPLANINNRMSPIYSTNPTPNIYQRS